jgi:DMSO/TMAO reductase YedYZ molybdopterin-dependent catalytic subunit
MVTVPPFVRSIPVEKALHPDTIVAYEMNGEPLPLLHGAPLRVITPGWMAESCIKWPTDIVVREDEATGYYMQTAYRVPARSSQNAEIMIPVEAMPVKSLIVSPESGDTVKVGSVTIQGVAWTGTSKVVSVELSMDEGKTWEPAQLLGKDQPYAWRQWQFTWSAKVPGIFPLVCRATDAQGNAQAAIRVWNPGGFLWNGWDRVTVQVDT